MERTRSVPRLLIGKRNVVDTELNLHIKQAREYNRFSLAMLQRSLGIVYMLATNNTDSGHIIRNKFKMFLNISRD